VVVTPRFVRALAPGEQPAMPENAVPFLPTIAEQKAAKDGKKKKDDKKPEFVGPRGHQLPN
jgi:hypothetical protein